MDNLKKWMTVMELESQIFRQILGRSYFVLYEYLLEIMD